MKKYISFVLCILLALASTACSNGNGNVSSSSSSRPQSSSNSGVTSSQNSSVTNSSTASGTVSGNSFDESIFEKFESGLKELNLDYTAKDADAGLAKAEKGVTYSFSDNQKVEVYLFNDSNLLAQMANSAVITIEGLGELPVEMNGNLVLLAGDAPDDKKDDIIKMFKDLK